MQRAIETLDDLIADRMRHQSLEALAFRAGISPRQLWALRHGTVSRPHEATIARLAQVLDVSLPRLRAALQAAN